MTNREYNLHAETDALRKMIRLIRRKHIKYIELDLVVVKYSNNCEFQKSAPCKHCCQELFKTKKIKINNLYYSNSNDEIVKIDFNTYCQNVTYVSRGHK